MAQKRMFDKAIVRTDKFLDMPDSTQNLYFHLGMECDDEGFISPKMVMRTVNSKEDDLKLLIAKGYAIPCENGVIFIRHWTENNWLDTRRIKPTMYQLEKQKMLENTELIPLLTECLAPAKQLLSQSSIEQSRVEQSRIEKNNINYSDPFLEFYKLYPRKVGKLGAFKKWETIIKKVDYKNIIKGLQNQLDANMFSDQEKYIKHPEVWLNKGCWEDEIKKVEKKNKGSIKI